MCWPSGFMVRVISRWLSRALSRRDAVCGLVASAPASTCDETNTGPWHPPIRAITLRDSRSSASTMSIKIEMLTIYGLLSSYRLLKYPRCSFVVESMFVNYLTGRVNLAEYEIRSAKPACREDGGRDYAVGLTGACAEKMAPELRNRAGGPLGSPGRLPFRNQ